MAKVKSITKKSQRSCCCALEPYLYNGETVWFEYATAKFIVETTMGTTKVIDVIILGICVVME